MKWLLILYIVRADGDRWTWEAGTYASHLECTKQGIEKERAMAEMPEADKKLTEKFGFYCKELKPGGGRR